MCPIMTVSLLRLDTGMRLRKAAAEDGYGPRRLGKTDSAADVMELFYELGINLRISEFSI